MVTVHWDWVLPGLYQWLCSWWALFLSVSWKAHALETSLCEGALKYRDVGALQCASHSACGFCLFVTCPLWFGRACFPCFWGAFFVIISFMNQGRFSKNFGLGYRNTAKLHPISRNTSGWATCIELYLQINATRLYPSCVDPLNLKTVLLS